MATSKSRLGRGLGGLIAGGVSKGNPAIDATNAAKAVEAAKSSDGATAVEHIDGSGVIHHEYAEVPVDAVRPSPYQPRRDIDPDRVAELAESIRAEGLLQPIVVRKRGDHYELIAGERRWRACKELNLRVIPARLVKASDASSAAMSLIENLQREGLNPVEEALGYASLMRDFDLTQESVSERVGKGRATIANSLRLLALDEETKGYLAKGMLSIGHAKVLLGVEDPAQRSVLARRVIEERLSVRELEKIVKTQKSARERSSPSNVAKAEETAIRDIERRISSTLGTQVQVKHKDKKGKIIIDYFGNDDLQRILEAIGVGG